MRKIDCMGVLRRFVLPGILSLGAIVLLYSCNDLQGVESLHLFSLQIGRSEDQIDLVQRETVPFRNEINVVVRDGLIYVSDGVAGKIMRFNSYGDLLMLLYDSRTNPTPVLVATESGEGRVANRTAQTYEFEGIGSFDVAGTGILYVQDKVPESDMVVDEESGAKLRFVVRRFSPDGMPIDHIGVGGVDGAPFPFIHDVSVGEDGALTVVSRTAREWLIYAYDTRGEAVNTLRIAPEDLPLPGDAFVVSVGTMIPANGNLYVEADYYDDSAGDVTFVATQVLVVDQISGAVDAIVRLPKVFSDEGARRSSDASLEVMYELLGAVDELIYCLAPVADSLYRMLVVNTDGATEFLGIISIEESQTLLRTFHLSTDGLLTAIVAEPLEARILAWRFDEITKERTRETG